MIRNSKFDSVMEAENHLKNEANLKNQTSRGNILRKACVGLLAAGIIFFFINAYTGVSNPERWEYKILELNIVYGDNTVNSDTLNQLGKLGWDIIFVTVGDQTNGKTPTHLFTLKRKLP